jgi:hypothetical protein
MNNSVTPYLRVDDPVSRYSVDNDLVHTKQLAIAVLNQHVPGNQKVTHKKKKKKKKKNAKKKQKKLKIKKKTPPIIPT